MRPTPDLANGVSIADICKKLDIAENTYYCWKNRFGGIRAGEMKRLRELEKEDARLEALVADLSLDKVILQESLRGNSLSPARRRQAVARAMATHKLSERRACRALGGPRSTLRYPGVESGRDGELLLRIEGLARKRPRFGYRRVTALLRRDGWAINPKRVHRLWRAAGLKVPRAQRKRRRVGSSDNSCTRHRTERPNHVWSYAFVMDQTADGKRLKILPVVDESTRRCLTIQVERSMTAGDVVSVLDGLLERHGEPEYIRGANGPKFVAEAVRSWLARRGSRTLYIAPGSPRENAWSESFNSRFRDEFLDREVFATLTEAQVLIEDHRRRYNDHRPHSSLGYQTPSAFAAGCCPPIEVEPDSQLFLS